MNYKFFRVRIQIFSIYLLALIAQFIGKCFFLFKDTRKISVLNIDKIIINRSDRMGDAVISYIWIESLIFYLNEHWFIGSIEILSSQLNYWILEPLSKYENVEVKMIQKDLNSYVIQPSQHLINGFRSFLRTFKLVYKRLPRGNVAFLDLVSDPTTIARLLLDDASMRIFGPNLALSSWIIDNGYSKFYTVDGINIISSYNLLLQKVFIEWVAIAKKIDTNYSLKLLSLWESETYFGITIFVGVKPYRNFTAVFWAEIITKISIYFPNELITVIDDPDGEIVKELIYINFPKNVVIKDISQKLTELIKFISTQKCLVGIDGGWMNILRMNVPSFTIYTTGDARVWSSYSDGEVVENSIWNNWYIWYRKGYSHKSKYLSKKSFFLPSFEVELEKSFFENFDIDSLVHSIKDLL